MRGRACLNCGSPCAGLSRWLPTPNLAPTGSFAPESCCIAQRLWRSPTPFAQRRTRKVGGGPAAPSARQNGRGCASRRGAGSAHHGPANRQQDSWRQPRVRIADRAMWRTALPAPSSMPSGIHFQEALLLCPASARAGPGRSILETATIWWAEWRPAFEACGRLCRRRSPRRAPP